MRPVGRHAFADYYHAVISGQAAGFLNQTFSAPTGKGNVRITENIIKEYFIGTAVPESRPWIVGTEVERSANQGENRAPPHFAVAADTLRNESHVLIRVL